MIKKLVVFVGLAGIGAVPAKADPFVQAKGEGRVIVTAIHTESSRGFDSSGNVVDINDYDQDQVYFAAEYGVTDDLTLLLTPSYRSIDVQNDVDTKGLGYTEIGARYRLAHGPNWIVSTQGLLRIPGKGRSDLIAQVGNTSTDVDMRIGAAYSTERFFLGGEGGYRLRSGSLPNEFRADFNAGVHIAEKFMLLASSQNTFSDGAGTRIYEQKYRYGDLFLSGVYDVSDHVSLQAGYTATVYGKNALRQRGPLVGVWFKF